MQHNTDPYAVQSVDRALMLLTLVSARGELGVHDAARALNVAASTTHRLLSTMAFRGYVIQGEDRLYRPGPRILGPRVEERIPHLIRIVRPFLQDLNATVQETVHLLILSGQEVKLLDGFESHHNLRVTLRTGTSVPAHAAAAGKAVLAEMDPRTVVALYAEGVPPSAGNGPGSVTEILAALGEVRQRQYGLNEEEVEPGVGALGASISLPERDLHAGLSIAAPTVRFDRSIAEKHGQALLRTCELVRAELRSAWDNEPSS
ncbi:IclR family transcriptional regulator [Georgenia sp. SYP-B2076]|uniref:IclR family transcriptional regulator n=1 Tax=Georgenia sp. SYP-B2076 TaxID=2495881 RepID=UPI000F8F2C5D|nr:IclR family transcriptional regulator [Georgenia sp. SYP-B2076]